MRGQDYIAVIDPNTYRETRRIETTPGPGMVIFHPNGKYAYVCNSFNAKVDIVDVAAHQVIKKLDVVSPFSPFIQITPDQKEVWLTHKDVGKVTRIDADKLVVKSVFDTGFITNHLGFAKTAQGTLAYITIGGENAVKVFTTETPPKLIATIPVGALPHGIWPSDDGSRMFAGLENSDAVDVIDTAQNKVIARIPVGQAPQALVYVSNAVPSGEGSANLSPLANSEPINIALKPTGSKGKGFIVVRNIGLVDTLEISLYDLKPDTPYQVYVEGEKMPVAAFKTNPKGMLNGTAIGPLREVVTMGSDKVPQPRRIFVMEGNEAPNLNKAVLVSAI